jgi:hypothetical protein
MYLSVAAGVRSDLPLSAPIPAACCRALSVAMSPLSARAATPRPAARGPTLSATGMRARTVPAALRLVTALETQGRPFQPLAGDIIHARSAFLRPASLKASERPAAWADDAAAQSLHRIGVALGADALAKSPVTSATAYGPVRRIAAFVTQVRRQPTARDLT